MTETDSTDVCFAEFLDDYFVECEEHLAIARRNLLGLDASVGKQHPDRSLLEELFRSFHSLKGLSAMVAVHHAERLAHEMESYLSGLRKDQVFLTAEGLDALIEGVKCLEQVIACHRERTSSPDIEPLVARLAELLPKTASPAYPVALPDETVSPGLNFEKEAALAAALLRGDHLWRFAFRPSPELAQRGINVNSVRQRLQDNGELISASPEVSGQGQVTFTFIVASRAPDSTFEPWRSDGVDFVAYQPATKLSPDPEPAKAPSNRAIMPSNVVRVDLGRLDDLMRQVGEMVISRSRLDDQLQRMEPTTAPRDWRSLQETNLALERQLRDLREGVMRVRMVPVREVFARMQFVVRDLAREYGKSVSLELTGQDTEIDKLIVERMMDPLLHLVRNAVSHGLETPNERTSRSKPPEGKLSLRASTTGETILIEVEDDGRGLDTDAIFAKARAAGLSAALPEAGAASLLDVICTPGFSTRDGVDRGSGRGVGMSVVRSVVEELGGSLALENRPGLGTRFSIQLPLTLSIADALIVELAGQPFAVPQVSVREVLHVLPESVTTLENNELISNHGGVLPLLRLASFFGLGTPTARPFYALVVGAGLGAVGLAVDRVIGLREIVVRPLTDPMIRVPGVSGATELGDGRAVLILDALALTRAARKQERGIWSADRARVVMSSREG